MMFEIDDLKSAIFLLEENSINYFVFGGIALDGLRGIISRPHSDLDIFVSDYDLSKVKEIFESKGFNCIKRENMYFFDKGDKKIGVVVLTKEKNNYIVNGNKTLEIYPDKIFETPLFGNVNKIKFRVAPAEVLVFESQQSEFDADKKFGSELSHNKELYNKINYTFLRKSRGL